MATNTSPKPPLPPFTLETARIKVKAAQDAWNTKYFPLITTPLRVTHLSAFLGIHKLSKGPIPQTQFGETEINSLKARTRL